MSPLLTAAAAARAIREGEVSPVDLALQSLETAERWQPATNAFSQLRPEESLAEARDRADAILRGDPLGPLHGVPVAVKDLFDVAGWETSGCCRAYRGRVADRDAESVRLLRDAGAVIIGKTNQHELAAGATNLVSACGRTGNPWDPGRITGGSSGGSAAAVAAGIVPVALGTDTGGSVRIPAALCGTAGLKPTHGRVSLDGVMPLAPSLDTVGPLAVTVEDVALAFEILAGTGPTAPETGSAMEGIRIGLVEVHDTPVHPEVAAACQTLVAAIRDTGAAEVTVMGGLGYDPDDWGMVGWTEMARAHPELLDRTEELEAPTRAFLERGARTTAAAYEEGRRRASRLRKAFLERLREADVLVAPVTPFPAPRADERVVDVGGTMLDFRAGAVSVLTRPANLAGLPGLAVQVGFSEEGLPFGAQLIGRPNDEETLLRAGRAFQEVTDHHLRRPPSP